MRTLYPYQEEMVRYLKNNPKAALYAEMRLGKSLCTIRALKDVPGDKLIICPKSVISTWVEELKKERIFDVWAGNTTALQQVQNYPEWSIINYDAVQKLKSNGFKHIVIDESVSMKNPKAKLTRLLLESFSNAESKILLSGNPAPNTPLDYFSQMQFLYTEWMGCKTYWMFRHRYFMSTFNGWAWYLRHSAKMQIQNNLKKSCYFLSRKDVGVDNKKIYEKRVIEMPIKLKNKYERLEKDFVASLPSGKEIELKHVIAQLIYLQEMASGFIKDEEISDFKIKELVSLLHGELNNEQVLIWCRFRWEIKKICQTLEVYGINGDTPLAERKRLQKEFNEGKHKVLVLQINTGRYGLNLAGADTAIYFSNDWSYDSRSQSEMRIESNEKTQPLLYIDLVTKDSIDEDILKNLKKKETSSNYFMGRMIEGIKGRVK